MSRCLQVGTRSALFLVLLAQYKCVFSRAAISSIISMGSVGTRLENGPWRETVDPELWGWISNTLSLPSSCLIALMKYVVDIFYFF